MASAPQTDVPAPTDAVGRGRWKLLALGAFFAVPVLAGWLAYLTGWVPGTTSNYGTLLQPQPLGAPAFQALRGKWVLVQIDAAACDERCERKLYMMRQVRRAQGREMNRVERLWIVTDAAPVRPGLLAAIEDTKIARGDAKLAAAFGGGEAVREHVYLVDPLGNLMLRFPRDPDPSKMVKDLERLLKYSSFG